MLTRMLSTKTSITCCSSLAGGSRHSARSAKRAQFYIPPGGRAKGRQATRSVSQPAHAHRARVPAQLHAAEARDQGARLLVERLQVVLVYLPAPLHLTQHELAVAAHQHTDLRRVLLAPLKVGHQVEQCLDQG